MDDHPGPAIAKARKRRGMSQRQLAEAAGISPTTVRKLEREELDPHDHTLGKIYNVLGWPDGDDDTDIADLAGRWSSLSDDERARVLGYIDGILEDRDQG